MFITLKRVIRSGFKAFLRNGFLSASSILVMSITMTILVSVFFSTILVKATTAQLEKKVDINIYFLPEAPVDQVLEFKDLIFSLKEVDGKKTNYKTKDNSLREFKQKHKDNESIIEALSIVGENPLGAVLNIKAKDISRYETIALYIDRPDIKGKYGDIISKLNYNQNKKAIEKLDVLIKYTYKIGVGLSLVLILISLIVTFNTMRLIIFTYKEEISIMRLVGASKFFARGPFLIEGILYGIISAIFSLFIIWSVVFYVSPILNKIFILNINQYFSTHILEIGGSLILGGIILGFISTYLAVSRYLKI